MIKRDLNKNILSMKISKNYFSIYFMFLNFIFKSAHKNQLESNNKIQLKKNHQYFKYYYGLKLKLKLFSINVPLKVEPLRKKFLKTVFGMYLC